ncbi:MAG: YvcK family protein, partial [Tissierellales bacterium]
YTVLDHVEAILKHSREDFLDYVIVNTEQIPEYILNKYIHDGSEPVLLGEKDEEILNSKGIKLIKEHLVDVKKEYIRHDSIKLSQILMKLANKDDF